MIVLTTLSGEQFGINEELIAKIEGDPQTRIHLTTGDFFAVAETMTEVARLTRLERAETISLARLIDRRANDGNASPGRSENKDAGSVVQLRPPARSPDDTGNATNR